MRRVDQMSLPVLVAIVALASTAAGAGATPIPGTPSSGEAAFTGTVATQQPIAAPEPPRHPHMAPNGRSNLHENAYQTDTLPGHGPLGRGGIRVTSTFYGADCGSVTFDARGRIVTACVGLAAVTLKLLDPVTLAELATYTLPARTPGLGNPFQNFTGGGYFYLDDQDRAVVPTADRHLVTVAVKGDGFQKVADVDLSGVVPPGDGIISALPDWSGRIWIASKGGVVATVDPATGTVRALPTGEGIGNSFAIDETGGVFIVTDVAMYRFDAAADGTPAVTWRQPYANIGTAKSGQSQPGSGTTPTLIGSDRVAITDNADPMAVVVLKRARTVSGPRLVCRREVFGKGSGSTDQSLIGTPDFVIVENNFGYTGPTATELGQTTTPGLARVDLHGDCPVAWTSDEIAPSVVPKLALGAGLVYTYTKPKRADGSDPWFLTTLDARTGRTVFRALSGAGLGFNNNYAPVTIGPDAAAYVGTLGGLVRLQDADPLPQTAAPAAGPAVRAPHLTARCGARHTVLAQVRGPRISAVRFAVRGRRAVTDHRRPFTIRLGARSGGRRLSARVTRSGAATVTLARTLPRGC